MSKLPTFLQSDPNVRPHSLPLAAAAVATAPPPAHTCTRARVRARAPTNRARATCAARLTLVTQIGRDSWAAATHSCPSVRGPLPPELVQKHTGEASDAAGPPSALQSSLTMPCSTSTAPVAVFFLSLGRRLLKFSGCTRKIKRSGEWVRVSCWCHPVRRWTSDAACATSSSSSR